jgi:putative YphP/YqiW family bacilliredoxin
MTVDGYAPSTRKTGLTRIKNEALIMYPPELTDPIRAEVKAIGMDECTTAQAVDAALAKPGTSLIYINSVCGCAAGGARPGLKLALSSSTRTPTQALTVFAGVDREATAAARNHFPEFPSSSPSAALLKDGEVVWFLHRHQIEGRSPQQIADQFLTAFATHC